MFKTNSVPKTLVPVDFSKGIRSDAITQNFDVLSNMQMRERLSVAGHGISSGLSINIADFKITVTEGALINLRGEEVFLEKASFDIPLPRLSFVKDEIYTIGEDGIIVLPHIPYHVNRQYAAGGRDQSNGLTVVDYNNSMNVYAVEATDGNIVTVNSTLKGKLVKVSYAYTNKRYDTVYIDTDNQIKIAEGTTSSSPSILLPEESTYILSFIEVDPYMTDTIVSKKAGLRIKEDLRGRRNLYTDQDNRLYICGTPFDDLQIIHMAMPLNPFENQLWYDIDHNKLKVWRTVDGIAAWINVNDTSIIPVLEQKLWEPSENPDDRKRFLFHNVKEHHLKFIPNRNELQVYVDQGVIHTDQFFEISLEDAKTDTALQKLLISDFGYTLEEIMNYDGHFENYGIGFGFYYPLENPSYVEARITHRVNENPLANRFQRSATFVAEGLTTVRGIGKEFETREPYRCGENQLEVFMDGKKLINGVQFKEGADLKDDKGNYLTQIKKGTPSYKYRILIDVPDNTFVHYKITTNIYSYDHIEGMVGGLGDRVIAIEEETQNALKDVTDTKQEVNRAISTMQTDIRILNDAIKEHSQFYRKTEKIPESGIDTAVIANTFGGLINILAQKNGQIISLDDVKETDYVTVHAISGSIQRTLVRGIGAVDEQADYRITQSVGGETHLVFSSSTRIEDGTTIYITGFKLKRIQP